MAITDLKNLTSMIATMDHFGSTSWNGTFVVK